MPDVIGTKKTVPGELLGYLSNMHGFMSINS